MRLLLLRLCMSAIFFIEPLAAPLARAQQDDARGRTGDFARLHERWQQTQDPEQKIALGEQVLSLELALTTWPLEVARERIRAEISFELGSAYLVRGSGGRAANLETAIAHFEATLTVWTREASPEDWARSHNNAAVAYMNRIRGERADNQDKAIAHLEAASTVFSRDTFPQLWGPIQNNLAVVYSGRIRGERTQNLESAIAHFEAAVEVLTRETVPHQWATAQHNLGAAYGSRKLGGRADNQDKQIAHLEAALSVFTREVFAQDWSHGQVNLAIAYLDRMRGVRADNQDRAIKHFEAALTVFTRETHPEQWAVTQHNLGNALANHIRRERGENRIRAIAAYEAALSVFTRDAFPRDHLRTSRLLARLLLEAREWHKAAPHHASAREAFLLLFGQGLDETETRVMIGEAGPLFAEAAFAAIERGETQAAIEIASEGRARLLAAALKLQTLDVSPEQRQRVDDLRAAIRVGQQAVETAQGIERAAALEKVIALRRELLGLVKGSRGQAASRSALAKARDVVAAGGAIAVPVITELGARIVVLAKAADGKDLTVVNLPDDTGEKLYELLKGPRTDPKLSGWFATYVINHLTGAEREEHWPRWLAAIDDLGPQLWQLFGGKLHAALKARGIAAGARLVLLPPGELGVLPLGLAQDPASKRRLTDTYEIAYAPSLEALAAAHDYVAKSAPPTLAVIINPTGDLPGTEKEGAIVASHFAGGGHAQLARQAATPNAVLAALKGKTHWHFASHGTFSWQDARQSALVMHGMELLSVGRLLETEGLGRPRLVVLSACETGLYDIGRNPDEFIGLPGTFTALGAVGVLGSLWPVDDTATALLVAKFYQLHMAARLPPPSALKRAQAWLRQSTSGELQAYARVVAAQGRVNSRHLAEINRELSAAGMARSRNSGVVERITQRDQTDKTKSSRKAQRARPYAHPYFWAGFVHTGL